MSAFQVSYIVLWLLLLVMGILVLLLYRHFGLVSMGTLEGVQRDGVPVGEQAPPVPGISADGEPVTWRPGPEPALLIFASPECEPCQAVLPHVRRLAMTVPRQALQVVAVTEGRDDDARRLRDKFELPVPCLAEGGSGAFSSYRVRVTRSASSSARTATCAPRAFAMMPTGCASCYPRRG